MIDFVRVMRSLVGVFMPDLVVTQERFSSVKQHRSLFLFLQDYAELYLSMSLA